MCKPSTLLMPCQHAEFFRDVSLLAPWRTWISSRLVNKPVWEWIISCSQWHVKRKHMVPIIYKWILPLVNRSSNTSQWKRFNDSILQELCLFVFLYHNYLPVIKRYRFREGKTNKQTNLHTRRYMCFELAKPLSDPNGTALWKFKRAFSIFMNVAQAVHKSYSYCSVTDSTIYASAYIL